MLLTREMDRFGSVEIDRNSLMCKFKYLGHRNYVHGSSMLDGLLRAIELLHPGLFSEPIVIKQFRIIKELTSCARAEVMALKESSKHPFLKDAVARLSLVTSDGLLIASLFTESNNQVRERVVEYDAHHYVREARPLAGGKGRAKLRNIVNLVDLIRGIVEANRQLTWLDEDLFGRIDKMRWAYIANFPLISDAVAASITAVDFVPKLLTKNRQGFLPVKEVHLEGARMDAVPDIAFFVQSGEQYKSLDWQG